jgi:hydrogenase maturation factor HypF (carbamoyltransferase family)
MKKTKIIEYLLPSLIAWSTNRRIREQAKRNEWNTLFDHWKKTINTKKTHSFEKAVDDVYQSEMQRKGTVESKAASMFEAIGFAVSLVSVAVVFAEKNPLLVVAVLPLVNFILAGICSWHATKIGEFFLPTLESIRENLEQVETKQRKHWIIEKLVDTEMNSPFILIKSNWLAAAYQHFLLGILLIIMFFVVIIFGPYFIQIGQLLNNVHIFVLNCHVPV